MNHELSDRELNALVAEKVMGLTLKHVSSGYGTIAISRAGRLDKDESMCTFCRALFPSSVYIAGERCEAAAPCYSTNISSAMEVVEKMRTAGWGVEIEDDGSAVWSVMFYRQPGIEVEASGQGEGDSLPRTICLAALSAVEGK